MIIRTAQQMYDATLEFYNKEQTGTIFPTEWDLLVNNCQHEVVKNRYHEVELIQKRIDDLRILHVVDVIANTGNNVATEELFVLPYNDQAFVTTTGNPNGDNHGYMFMLNVSLKLNYVNNVCGLTGISDFLKAKVMKSDKRFEIVRDPWNKPKDERVYYEIIGNNVKVITGTDSWASECRMEYIRYPRDIRVSVPQVDCELPIHIREEIVDLCVRKKLQQSESPRYQGKMIEDAQSIQ